MSTLSPPSARDWPAWWFITLDAAIKRGDRRTAQEALRNLARLGVEVRFTLPPFPEEEGADNAD
jgi:hypothetical protein